MSSSARGRTEGHVQGAKASGSGVHGAGQIVRSGRGHNQGHGQRHGKDTGVRGTGRGAGDRGRDPQHCPESKGERVRPNQGLGAGKGPKGKGGTSDVGPRGQAGRGAGVEGEEQGAGRGTGSRAPPQPDVHAVRCIPPGIQRTTPSHHHQSVYNIDPDMGNLILPHPPPTSRPPKRTVAPRASPPPRQRAEGSAGADGRCPEGAGVLRGASAVGAGAAGRAGIGERGGRGQLGPGLGRTPRPPEGRGPPPGDGGLELAQLGHLGDHQGVEEPALQCLARLEGRGEPGSTPERTTERSSRM